MKKLMIAAAIVCAAAFAQASCADWTVYVNTADVGADLYLVNASSLAEKTLSALAEADVKDNALTWSTGSGTTETNPIKEYYTMGTVTYKTANDADLSSSVYAILVKDGEYSIMNNGSAIDISANMYQPGEGAKAGKMLSETSAHTYTKFAGDVPEPTSAMLLLLGVAGLALRRRA